MIAGRCTTDYISHKQARFHQGDDQNIAQNEASKRKDLSAKASGEPGAGGGTRTHTTLPSRDFKSDQVNLSI
jgi:hypothetical protein